MADGLCVEGTATNDNGTSVNETIDLLGIPRTDSLNTKELETLKPAFYINGESGELCSNFRVNGVVTLGVHASRDMLCSANTDHVDFTSLCPDTVDNCRKKRCADRYDSSESSDSGVATLSCTDCSASSSSATSDITEPGSPFSSASSHSSHSDGGVEGGSGGSGGGAAEEAARWPPGSPSAADPSAAPAPSPARPAAPHCAGAPSAAVVVLQPYFMAPNVPSDQRDDSLHCWAWAGVGVGVGGGKDGGAVELERDRGPPPPPPPLQQSPPPPSTAPLSPVTANNVLASINSKALKRQTAIVSHKTAPVTSSPGNKRLKLDHSPSSKPGLANNNNNNNNNASGKNATSLCAALRHQPQRCCAALLHPKTASAKGVKADAKARAIGSALVQGDASAHSKLHQQGKITEYFKTQMKPVNGMKKDLTAKAAGVVGAAGLPGNRKSVADVKTDKNSAGGLEKYFNVNSGTQSSAVPLSKVPEVKDLIGANLPASAPVQSLSWNSKCNTVCSNRSSKAAQKANEKKNVVALSSLAAKELSSPATTLKIPDVKKNGYVSPSLASQKLNVLLLPPPSMQNDSSPSTYSPNLPESTSCVTDVTQKASDVVYDVPKPSSASDDMLPANEVMVTSTPVGKITPVSEDSAMSTSGDQTESIASVSSDSGLSISVSSSSPAPSSLPSPILSVPRTIRFPAVNCNRPTSSKGATGESSEATTCRWTECNAHFDSSSSLLEHLQAKHVNTQGMCETFVCLWVGCKVYARTSCSRSWLERHVLSHGGNKPFPCIVDGCGQRFSSQTTLERHVNSHFNQSEAGGSGSGARRSVDSSSSKLFRRNGKRLRLRRQPWSGRDDCTDFHLQEFFFQLEERIFNSAKFIKPVYLNCLFVFTKYLR